MIESKLYATIGHGYPTGMDPELDLGYRVHGHIDNRQPAWQVAKSNPEKFRHALAVAKMKHKWHNHTGTAFRIGSANLMLTNAHVLNSENATDFEVEFTDAQRRSHLFSAYRLLARSWRFSSPSNVQQLICDKQGIRQGMDFAVFLIKARPDDLNTRFPYLQPDPLGAKPWQSDIPPAAWFYNNYSGDNSKRITIFDDTSRDNLARFRETYKVGYGGFPNSRCITLLTNGQAHRVHP